MFRPLCGFDFQLSPTWINLGQCRLCVFFIRFVWLVWVHRRCEASSEAADVVMSSPFEIREKDRFCFQLGVHRGHHSRVYFHRSHVDSIPEDVPQAWFLQPSLPSFRVRRFFIEKHVVENGSFSIHSAIKNDDFGPNKGYPPSDLF